MIMKKKKTIKIRTVVKLQKEDFIREIPLPPPPPIPPPSEGEG
jgi:hypothetical protein